MRKRISALLCACLLLLSACGRPAPSQSASQSAPPPAASQPPEPEQAEAGPLRMLREDNLYADDAPGMVEYQRLANDGGFILLYNDYAAATQAPLCNAAACPHNNALCKAYLPATWLGDRAVIAGGYVFFADSYDSSPYNALDLQFFLVRYALDGSGGELVFDLPGDFSFSDAILTDDRYLYFDIGNWSETEAVDHGGWHIGPRETYLIRVEIATGAVENLRPMTDRNLLGVVDGQLLMWELSTEPAGLVLYSLEEEKETSLPAPPEELADIDTNDSTTLYDGLIYRPYRAADKSFHLMAWDPVKGEVAFDIQRDRSISIEHIAGGYIASSQKNLDFEKGEGSGTSYPDKSAYYTWVYFDAKTGEQRDMPLYLPYDAPRPLNANFEDSATVDGQAALLVGTSGGRYVLASGYYAVPYYDADIGEELFFSRDTYALIQPEDYWAGRASLTEIAPFAIDTTGEPVTSVSPERQRQFAFGAVLTQRNRFGFGSASVFSPYDRLTTKNWYATGLFESWGITNRQSALDSLDWLMLEGHRVSGENNLGLNEYYATMVNFASLSGLEQAAYGNSKAAFDVIMAEMRQMSYSDAPVLSEADLAGVKTLSAWDYDRLVTIARWCYSLDYITEEEMYGYIDFAAEQAVLEYENWHQYFAAVIIGRTLWSGEEHVAADESALAYQLFGMESGIYNLVMFESLGEML